MPENFNKLREQLLAISKKKDKAFKKRARTKKEIRETFNLIKEKKGERDSYNKEVKELKEKRNILNSRTKELSKIVKSFKDDLKTVDTKINPRELLRTIEKLDLQIETEVIPYEKEKELMKQIKDLNAQLGKMKDKAEKFKEHDSSIKELRKVRTESNNIHKKFISLTKKSQECHEIMISNLKQIDNLKKTEKETEKEFESIKEEFDNISKKVGAEVTNNIQKTQKKKTQKKKIESKILKKSKEEVEQKIKKKEKLTTEDLIAFQSEAKL